MNKLILIDGNSLLFRAYFAMRPMVTSKGIHTQGVFAFVNMLVKILKDYDPTHIAVAFDLKGGTFRHDVYKEYKAGRLKTPPELLSQIPLLHDVLEAMNISVLEVPQYEADDIIGTVAARAEKDGIDTLVISGDKDELQLIGPHVKVLINKRGMSEFDLYDIDAGLVLLVRHIGLDIAAVEGLAAIGLEDILIVHGSRTLRIHLRQYPRCTGHRGKEGNSPA